MKEIIVQIVSAIIFVLVTDYSKIAFVFKNLVLIYGHPQTLIGSWFGLIFNVEALTRLQLL